MPKLIANLRESILKAAKEELLLRGYDALAIRSIARACGIAVGTVYNYFPSKDMLAASVLLEDWMAITERMRNACEQADTVTDALRALYERLMDYYGVYRPVWEGYTFSDSAKTEYGKRHNMLVSQLSECIRPVLTRCNANVAEGLDTFLVENVLICAGSSTMTFDMLLGIVQRILP